MTAFVVERHGRVQRLPKMDKLGMRGSPTSEIVFTGCHIPDDQVLGEVDGGVRVLMSGLDSERVVLSGGPIGIMQAAIDLVLPYVRERRQFGVPIGSFELMQGKVADMYVALSLRLRLRRGAPVRSHPGRASAADAAEASSRRASGAGRSRRSRPWAALAT